MIHGAPHFLFDGAPMGFLGFGKPAWQKQRDRAEKFCKTDELGLAIPYFERAIENAPAEEKSALEVRLKEIGARLHKEHVRMARKYEGVRDYERALDRWELAIDFAPRSRQREEAAANIKRIEAKIEAGEDDAASCGSGGDSCGCGPKKTQHAEEELDDINSFNVLVSQMPELVEEAYHDEGPAFRSAFLLLHSGKLEEALAWLEEEAKTNDAAVVHFELGRAYRALGRNAEALEAYKHVEQAEDEWINPKLAIAELAWAEKNWELAEEVLQRAVDQDPENPEVLLAVCNTALLTECPDYGIEAADVILEKESTNRNMLLMKGRLLEMSGKRDEAIAIFEVLVGMSWRVDPYSGDLVFDRDGVTLLLDLYMKSRTNLDRAEELSKALLSKVDDQNRWIQELTHCEVLHMAGHDDAVEEAEKLLKKIPMNQPIGQIRAAQLAGQTDVADRLLAKLSPPQLAQWKRVEARFE